MDDWDFGIWVGPRRPFGRALLRGRNTLRVWPIAYGTVHPFLLGYSWIGLGLVTILVIMHL